MKTPKQSRRRRGKLRLGWGQRPRDAGESKLGMSNRSLKNSLPVFLISLLTT
jgi:hypothetical protein